MQSDDFSITKTAENIHLEHSALSRQLSSLEEELGVSLFDRSEHKKIRPTKEAYLFYKEAIKYINGIDGLVDDFKGQLRDINDNHLNIAMHKAVASFIFPPMLERMLKLKKFKDLKVSIHNISKAEAIKKLISKDIDLAFYIQDSKDETPAEIEAINFMQSCAFLIFSKSHALAKKDIITKEDIENYKFLKNNNETKVNNNVASYFKTKRSNIDIVGSLLSEVVLEIVKHTDNIAIVSEISGMFLKNNIYVNDPDIETRNIEHLIQDKAFFQVMKLKNYPLSKPASWVMDEFKNLKLKYLNK